MSDRESSTSNKGMKTIEVTSECSACLRRLIESTAQAASPSCALREKAVQAAWDVVERLKNEAGSPAHLANQFHPLIKMICNNPDPFALQKRQEMKAASDLVERYRPPDDASFREWLTFAARGNAIDFFRPAGELETWFRQTVHFGIDQIDLLERKLEDGNRSVLWLADNAGEAFFDLPFLDRLSRKGHEVFYAVKGDAVQNDLSMKDLRDWPVDTLAVKVVDTGAATVGLELDRVSEGFYDLFHSVDLVIAKGMGHFETLAGRNDPRLFLILMAKCAPVARALGVLLNHFVAFFAYSVKFHRERRENDRAR